jgi:hypothetical protein
MGVWMGSSLVRRARNATGAPTRRKHIVGIPEGIFALAPEVMLLPASGSRMSLYAIVVPMEHDASYKLLFSHARMVEDLLRGFVHEAWVREVDFTSLERVSGSYVSEDLRDREDDMIWRVRWE